MNLQQLSKWIDPLKRRVMLMIGRAVIKASDDASDLQVLQMLLNAGEVRGDIQRVQEYGFTSRPLDGAEAVVIFQGGNRDHGIVVAVDDRRYRVKSLQKGEVAFYNDKGVKILLATSKNVEVTGIEKLKFQNSSHELIEVLSDLIQAIIDARTNTMLGPQPLLHAADPFPDIKARLDTFKV